MTFWLRYLFFLALCIVAPLGFGFFVDTQSEVVRAQAAGDVAATSAVSALNAQLTLQAHRLVGRALTAAQAISDERLLAKGNKPDSLAKMVEAVNAEVDKEGFGWVADETGTIIARANKSDVGPAPAKITGHPLFVSTQRGFALDSLWAIGSKIYFVAAAPLVSDNEARGSVLLGSPIDQELVTNFGKQIGTEVSVVSGNALIASSMPTEIFAAIGPKLTEENSTEPVHAGRRPAPLPSHALPFLPLFVSKDADGVAYSSIARLAPGSANVRWVISVPSSEQLRYLAERQEAVLAVLTAAVLLALVFGLMLHRSYVRPISRLVEHLSELQQGRGERELPEVATARPFRRLVKLVNMTVQRIPTSTFGAYSEEGVLPRSSLAMRSNQSDLGLPSLPPAARPSDAPPDSEDVVVPSAVSLSSPRIQSSSGLSSPAPKADGMPAAADSAPSRISPPPPAHTSNPSGPAPIPLGGSSKKIRSASEIRGVSASEIRGTPANSIDLAQPKRAATPSGLSGGEEAAALLSALSEFDNSNSAPQSADPFGGSSKAGLNARSGGSAGSGSGLFGSAGLSEAQEEHHTGDFKQEATVVAAPNDYLLKASKTLTGSFRVEQDDDEGLDGGDGGGLDSADTAHFKETYERFVEMRKQCGESTADLAFDRFVAKLRKNRDGLIKKYNCKTVRFQVYEKDGKAALKATPVRA
jgi:hypothetical protein